MIAEIILFAMLTSAASAAHGGDYAGKGWIVTAHGLLSLSCGLFAPLGVAAFWLFLRRGEQARAELDYISGKGGIDAVRAAYPLGVGYIIAPVVRYARWHPWPDFGHHLKRRQQEIVTGFALGLLLAVPFIIIPQTARYFV